MKLSFSFFKDIFDVKSLDLNLISSPEKISFNNFARDNGFSFLHYNQFEIVLKNYITIKGKKQYTIDRKIIGVN